MNIGKEVEQFASWPVFERIEALKRIVPRATVEEILRQFGIGIRYAKRLPNWFLLWFVIGLGLFCTDSYRQVFRWLCRFTGKGAPGRSTLCEARKRLRIAPLRALAEKVVRLLCKVTTPGAFYAGMRLMALDGFVVEVADTPGNERVLGRPGGGRAPGAFPQARVLAMCELGSHALWRWLIKPFRCGEVTMAHYLLRFLEPNMLLWWDRNFLSYGTLQEVLTRRAKLLARIKKNLIFEPIQRCSDGSYRAKLYRSPRQRAKDQNGILVRIIEYTFHDPGRPGSGAKHRLLTTLLDADRYPAIEWIELYHERWEEELAIDELKTHQRERPVLRSRNPAGVVQELYGLLIGHSIVRSLMHQAAERKEIAPRCLSFTDTLKILRCRLPEVPRSVRGRRQWHRNLLAEIAEAVLDPRRNRINPRVIRCKMSRWQKKRPHHRHYPQPTKKFRESVVMLD